MLRLSHFLGQPPRCLRPKLHHVFCWIVYFSGAVPIFAGLSIDDAVELKGGHPILLRSLAPSTVRSQISQIKRQTCMWHDMGVSENSVPLNPMVLLIIIPMKNGYFIGNIPYFQTNPYSCLILSNQCFSRHPIFMATPFCSRHQGADLPLYSCWLAAKIGHSRISFTSCQLVSGRITPEKSGWFWFSPIWNGITHGF